MKDYLFFESQGLTVDSAIQILRNSKNLVIFDVSRLIDASTAFGNGSNKKRELFQAILMHTSTYRDPQEEGITEDSSFFRNIKISDDIMIV